MISTIYVEVSERGLASYSQQFDLRSRSIEATREEGALRKESAVLRTVVASSSLASEARVVITTEMHCTDCRPYLQKYGIFL